MELNPELMRLGTELAGYVGKSSVEAIWDRIRAAKAKENKDEIISKLEGIITELIADKIKLIQIAQAYEEQLISQTISEDEIEYITESIMPILEELLEYSEKDEAVKYKDALDVIKPILSKETFKILQLLGFNFKRAIGEPLTQLVRAYISLQIPTSVEHKMLVEQRQVEYLKVLQDEDAFQRHLKFMGRDKTD